MRNPNGYLSLPGTQHPSKTTATAHARTDQIRLPISEPLNAPTHKVIKTTYRLLRELEHDDELLSSSWFNTNCLPNLIFKENPKG